MSSWADLWRPDGNAQPQYSLAWRRFQADETTAFIEWQADIVRQYARPDQFVTTCLSYDRPAVDDEALGRRLDVISGNPYYVMQDALALPDRVERSRNWKIQGVSALFKAADRMYASRQAPYLVTETNASQYRRAMGQPPRVRRSVASGRLGVHRARRAHDRVLAVEHAAVRGRDLLGRGPAAQ